MGLVLPAVAGAWHDPHDVRASTAAKDARAHFEASLGAREVVLGHEHAADPKRRRRLDHQPESHFE